MGERKLLSALTFQVDQSSLEHAILNIETSGEVPREFIVEAKGIVVYRMALNAPRRTGRLISSIVSEGWETGFIVYLKAPYALFVDQGTGLFGPKGQLIFPRKAEALRFEVGGKTVFAKYVRGFPGRFFVRKTAEEVQPELFELADRLWREHHLV